MPPGDAYTDIALNQGSRTWGSYLHATAEVMRFRRVAVAVKFQIQNHTAENHRLFSVHVKTELQ